MDQRDIDLAPSEWTARIDDVVQPKPKEPLFGDGVPFFVVFCLKVAALTVIGYWWRGY
jgi:hypothetical protein